MTNQQLTEIHEWNYIFQERLGIITDGAKPTPEQVAQATQESNDHLKALKEVK